jgi:hypothetical protein
MIVLDALEPGEAGPLPRSAEAPFAAPTPVFWASNREEDETYGGVVAVLNPSLRVICGRCGPQWILQRRKNPVRWLSLAYCATKAGLVLRVKAHLQAQSNEKKTLPLDVLVSRYADPEAWRAIEGLPDVFRKAV